MSNDHAPWCADSRIVVGHVIVFVEMQDIIETYACVDTLTSELTVRNPRHTKAGVDQTATLKIACRTCTVIHLILFDCLPLTREILFSR